MLDPWRIEFMSHASVKSLYRTKTLIQVSILGRREAPGFVLLVALEPTFLGMGIGSEWELSRELIIGWLNKAEVGIPAVELCRKHGLSEAS